MYSRCAARSRVRCSGVKASRKVCETKSGDHGFWIIICFITSLFQKWWTEFPLRAKTTRRAADSHRGVMANLCIRPGAAKHFSNYFLNKAHRRAFLSFSVGVKATPSADVAAQKRAVRQGAPARCRKNAEPRNKNRAFSGENGGLCAKTPHLFCGGGAKGARRVRLRRGRRRFPALARRSRRPNLGRGGRIRCRRG